MFSQSQRWTVLDIFLRVVVCWGFCWCVVGVWVVVCPYELAEGYAIQTLGYLQLLTNGGIDFYIHSGGGESFYVFPPVVRPILLCLVGSVGG